VESLQPGEVEFYHAAGLAATHTGVDAVRLLRQIGFVAPEELGVAEHGLAQVRVVALQIGQQFVADAIAPIVELVVGLVVARLPAPAPTILQSITAREAENRSGDIATEGGHTGQPS
jgi:hypothetical protein